MEETPRPSGEEGGSRANVENSSLLPRSLTKVSTEIVSKKTSRQPKNKIRASYASILFEIEISLQGFCEDDGKVRGGGGCA